jgi:hypothetical protein
VCNEEEKRAACVACCSQQLYHLQLCLFYLPNFPDFPNFPEAKSEKSKMESESGEWNQNWLAYWRSLDDGTRFLANQRSRVLRLY